MKELIIHLIINDKSLYIQLDKESYVSFDRLLLDFNELVYHTEQKEQLNADNIAFLFGRYGTATLLPICPKEDVMIILDFDKQHVTYMNSLEKLIQEEMVKDEPVVENNYNPNKSLYEKYLDDVNEFRYAEERTEEKQVKWARRFYSVFSDCEIFMDFFFDEQYPVITRKEVYTAILNGVKGQEEWLYNAFQFMEDYMNLVWDSYEPMNGRYYIYVGMDKLSEYSAERKGASFDDKELLYYFTSRFDAYKFSEWLPISRDDNDEIPTLTSNDVKYHEETAKKDLMFEKSLQETDAE